MLKGWRRIADHLGRDESTVKRWAAQRGMPVHRLPGDRRSAVYADPDELEVWLKGGDERALAAPVPAVEPASPPAVIAPRRRSLIEAALLAAIAIGIAALAAWQLSSGQLRSSLVRAAVPEAHDLYLEGVYLWEKRTAESLRQAETLFRRATEIDPGYAQAFAGLANTYNLLREYSAMPAAEAYRAAVEAGRRAVALDPGDADALSALAFAEFYGLRLLPLGLNRFEQARTLAPDSAKTRHWLGNALLHLGRFEEALAELEEAQRLDPASRSIRSSKGLALFCAGRIAEAVALLTDMTRREPDYLSPHAYLAYLYLAQGDDPGYLAELEAVGALREDPTRAMVAAAGRQGLVDGGRDGMIAAMLAVERELAAQGRTLIYNVARLEALAGDWQAATASLEASVAAGEEHVMGLNIDPAFRPIRSNPAFRAFATGIGLPIM